MTHVDVISFLLGLGVLLLAARIMGELAIKLHQPPVIGEILAGILLGPTVFGSLAPEASAALFRDTPGFNAGLQGMTTLAIVLFLLVAGMEVDLRAIKRQGRMAISIAIAGMLVPFALGLVAALAFPSFFGMAENASIYQFPLFFATALSISALPVISKILMDLKLFRSDIGMMIVAAAILNDLTGWIVFAFILGMSGGMIHSATDSVWVTAALVAGFAVLMVTVGRMLIDRVLPWIQAQLTWPAGVFTFAISGALLCAAFTEWIGVHAVFGAFIFGIALGESRHLRAHTRTTLEQFISYILAPIFFASIGLKVNFIEHFDLWLVLVVLVLATVGKVGGALIGARIGGLGRREALAVGFGMNARGAMEIILGLMALQFGLIDHRLFVALVVMALVTSVTSGSLMQRVLGTRVVGRLASMLSRKGFCATIQTTSREEAITALAQCAAPLAGMDAGRIYSATWEREQSMSTGLGGGLAVPHARIEGLSSAVVVAGLAPEGVDFDAFDGEPVRVMFLILTPADDHQIQLDLLADIGRLFQGGWLVKRCAGARSFNEFLALLKAQEASVSHTTAHVARA